MVIPLLPIEPGPFRITLGVRALGDAPIALVDESRHAHEVGLRERLLAEDHEYRYRGGPGTVPAQWEVVALLLRDLARHYPEFMSLSEDGEGWTWETRLLGRRATFRLGDPGSLPHEPLDWVGRQVVEDLILLSGDAGAGFPVIAGQLCFPNDWSLPDKLGRRRGGRGRASARHWDQLDRRSSTDSRMSRGPRGRDGRKREQHRGQEIHVAEVT